MVPLEVGGEGYVPPPVESEYMGTVQLQLGLTVLAVAPGACVIYVVVSGFCAHSQRVKWGECLSCDGLKVDVFVLLPVLRGPGNGTRGTSFRSVVKCLEVVVSFVHCTEEVEASAELAYVIVLSSGSVDEREVAFADYACGVG